jgi:hypothetical protein
VAAYRPLSVSAVLDGGGRIHVAWYEDQSIAGDPGIFYATSRGGWHRERVTTGDSFYASPSIAVDDAGTVYIAFARLTCPTPTCETGTSRVMVAKRGASGSWTVTPRTSGPADLAPSLSIHAGRLHIAFQRHTFPGGRGDAASGIWYATNASGSWSQTQVTTANGRCLVDQLPSLALDDRGHAWIAYEGVRSGASCGGFSGGLRLATNVSGSWTRATLTTNADDFGPSLALDRLGRPGIAFDRAGVGVEFMRSAGSGWSSAALVDGQGGEPTLAFDSAGRPRVAYERGGTWYAALASGWQRTRLYGGPVDYGTYGGPAVLVPRSGDARVVYAVAEPDDDSSEDELGVFLVRQE